MRVEPYTYWVRIEALLVDSDGCTGVPQFRQDCCFEHDLGYHYAKDPRDAYRLWALLPEDAKHQRWTRAAPITRKETDKRFRQCNQSKSRFGRWSPFAAWRWAGVRILGRGSWRKRHG